LQTSVCSVAATTPGIVNTEKCRIRKSGIDLYVDIHIRVDPFICILDGHHLGHEVKKRLLAANPRIRDVIVHIEPATMAQPSDLTQNR
jgi:divalent metal cation (Fe/Co/Zn/Cd) transporter